MTRTRPNRRAAAALVALIVAAVLSWSAAAQAQAPPAPAPPDPPAAADRPAAPPSVPQMSMLELLAKGRWFMLPIGLCSLIGLAIIIERLVGLRRRAVIPPRFLDGLKSVFRHGRGDRREALDHCRSSNSPIARVLAAGVAKLHRDEETVEQAIEDAGINEIAKLRRNLRMLYGVAAVSPMLGLLGTVWGMISAFQVASVQGLGRVAGLATGIYEALVTTFAGLIVAIPVLSFYYYFLGKVERIVWEMNDVSMDFLEHVLVGEDRADSATDSARAPDQADSPPPVAVPTNA